jgi:hypothetical protein
MADNDPINDAVISNLFTFKSLVSFPLEAVIDSNIAASKSVLRFIEKFGFIKSKEKKLTPRSVVFYYNYSENGAMKEMKVELPVLSLVTLPFYEIEEAKFEMGINIISWLGLDTHKKHDIVDELYDSHPQEIVAMLGASNPKKSITLEKSSKHQDIAEMRTNMQATLKITTSDLPAGILQLINISQQEIKGLVNYDYSLYSKSNKVLFTSSQTINNISVKFIEKSEALIDSSDGNYNDFSDEILTIKIITNGENTDDVFSESIKVIKGDLIGVASKDTIKILATSLGEIEFCLQAKADAAISTNGFIKITSKCTEPLNIYYRINNG